MMLPITPEELLLSLTPEEIITLDALIEDANAAARAYFQTHRTFPIPVSLSDHAWEAPVILQAFQRRFRNMRWVVTPDLEKKIIWLRPRE